MPRARDEKRPGDAALRTRAALKAIRNDLKAEMRMGGRGRRAQKTRRRDEGRREMLEAVFGQLYLAVLVARLVSLYAREE